MTAPAHLGAPRSTFSNASSAGAPSTPPPAEPHAALAALCAIARLHQTAADPATLAHQLGLATTDVLQPDDLLRAAKHLGLKAKLSRTSIERLALTPLPALALMRHVDAASSIESMHVVILAQCDGKRVLFQDFGKSGSDRNFSAERSEAPAGSAFSRENLGSDPNLPAAQAAQATSTGPTIEPIEVFASHWTGELILITSRASLAGDLAKFDFSWFIPALVKYRKLLGEVLLISFVLQLFGLVSPLFFQVTMDKVLVHKGRRYWGQSPNFLG